MQQKLYHYVYLIVQEQTKHFYIGVRTSICDPKLDIFYNGSMKSWKREKTYKLYKKHKKVIKLFDSREEAELYEQRLIAKYLTHPLNKNYAIPSLTNKYK